MKGWMMVVLLAMASGVQAGELRLELHGKGMVGNAVRVAVYSAEAPQQFPSDMDFYRGTVSQATSDHLAVIIPDLPPGRYAVAAYLDNNRNGRQDKNFLGVPMEAYGFSNDVRGTFGPPDFSAAAFEVGTAPVSKSIHIH